MRGEFHLSLDQAAEAFEPADESDHAARSLAARAQANVEFILGQVDDGLASCRLQLEMADVSGQASRQAHAHYMLSAASSSLGEPELAREHAEAAHEAARRSGAPTDAAGAYFAQGLTAVGGDRAAMEAFSECDRLARSVGNRWMSAFARGELNSIVLRSGDVGAASRGLADVVDAWYRSGDWSQQWLALSKAIPALTAAGDLVDAALLVGAVETHASIAPPPLAVTVRTATLEGLDRLRTELGDDRYDELHRAGAALPVDEIVDLTRRRLLADA